MNQSFLFFSAILLTAFNQVAVHAATPAGKLLNQPDTWFQSEEGRQKLENVLSWQTANGDWPKNVDTTSARNRDKPLPRGTFDNGATTGEARLLARAYRVTNDRRYRMAAIRCVDHVLAAQYDNGGWPQFFPVSRQYHRHITFNDGTMIKLLEFLNDVVSQPDFSFIDPPRRTAAETAIERGHQCILRCQIIVDGIPTAWCAQHHAKTLAPVQGRAYEHPSLSGAESVGVLRYLMRIEKPSPEIIHSVKSGVKWLRSAQIDGYRYRKGASKPALQRKADANPLWARFYEIKTNRPIFSDRDGVIRYDIEEISDERRSGYTWFGNWGEKALGDFAIWAHR